MARHAVRLIEHADALDSECIAFGSGSKGDRFAAFGLASVPEDVIATTIGAPQPLSANDASRSSVSAEDAGAITNAANALIQASRSRKSTVERCVRK